MPEDNLPTDIFPYALDEKIFVTAGDNEFIYGYVTYIDSTQEDNPRTIVQWIGDEYDKRHIEFLLQVESGFWLWKKVSIRTCLYFPAIPCTVTMGYAWEQGLLSSSDFADKLENKP